MRSAAPLRPALRPPAVRAALALVLLAGGAGPAACTAGPTAPTATGLRPPRLDPDPGFVPAAGPRTAAAPPAGAPRAPAAGAGRG